MSAQHSATPIQARHLRQAVVAFVDLLGFRSRVNEATTEAHLLAIRNDVLFVQKTFEHKEPGRKDSDKTVLAFSDCLVITIRTDSKLATMEGFYDWVMAPLSQIAYQQAQIVFRGIFVRGGVSAGWLFRQRDVLFSPALNEAYELEQKQALVPMIEVAAELYLALEQHPHRTTFYAPGADEFDDVFCAWDEPATTARAARRHYFLDYLRLTFNAVDPVFTSVEKARRNTVSEEEREAIDNAALLRARIGCLEHHRDVVVSALRSAPTPRVREKYEWLRNYHNGLVAKLTDDFSRCRIPDNPPSDPIAP